MTEVFVYGSLMKGLTNHELLMFSEFLGNAVVPGYGLYRVEPDYPGIVKKPGSAVRGEVYRVDAATLEQLDHLEDEGELYLRQTASCLMEDGSEGQVHLYCWLGDTDESRYLPLESTPWRP